MSTDKPVKHDPAISACRCLSCLLDTGSKAVSGPSKCYRCPEPAVSGRVFCAVCAVRNAEAEDRRLAVRRAKRICLRCPRTPEEDLVVCRACASAAYASKKEADRRALFAGLCPKCGSTLSANPGPKFSTGRAALSRRCDTCKANFVKRTSARQKRLEEAEKHKISSVPA